MAGKPKKNSKTNSNWGGKRPNQRGRPKGSTKKNRELSEDQVIASLNAAKKKAKAAGRTIDDILLEIIYDSDKEHNRIAPIRLFKDFTMPKKSEKDVTIKHSRGPAIYLPERRPDPAKLKLIPGGES